MFDNIGSKIKDVAVVLTFLGIIISFFLGIGAMIADERRILSGVLIIIFGSLASWLSALTLYGFGQLIENTDALVEQGNQKKTKKANNDDFL